VLSFENGFCGTIENAVLRIRCTPLENSKILTEGCCLSLLPCLKYDAKYYLRFHIPSLLEVTLIIFLFPPLSAVTLKTTHFPFVHVSNRQHNNIHGVFIYHRLIP